jgi:hypothetical protein
MLLRLSGWSTQKPSGASFVTVPPDSSLKRVKVTAWAPPRRRVSAGWETQAPTIRASRRALSIAAGRPCQSVSLLK